MQLSYQYNRDINFYKDILKIKVKRLNVYCLRGEIYKIELETKDCIRWTIHEDLCVSGTQVICGVTFQANLCPFCEYGKPYRGVENLLSNSNLLSRRNGNLHIYGSRSINVLICYMCV